MKHFNRLACTKLTIPSDQGIVRAMVKNHFQKKLCVQEPLRGRLSALLEELLVREEHISLYVKVFLSTLLPENCDGLPDTDPAI